MSDADATHANLYQELSPADHAARLARTYELARDLGGMARELMAQAARADRAAHRQDIDLLAEASDDISDLAARYGQAYISMLAVRVRPRAAEPHDPGRASTTVADLRKPTSARPARPDPAR